MKVTMWLVRKGNDIYNAYPRKIKAEVFASGFSDSKDIEIIEGEFIAEEPTNKQEQENYHSKICNDNCEECSESCW